MATKTVQEVFVPLHQLPWRLWPCCDSTGYWLRFYDLGEHTVYQHSCDAYWTGPDLYCRDFGAKGEDPSHG